MCYTYVCSTGVTLALLCCQAREELTAEREKNEQSLADKIQLTEVCADIVTHCDVHDT